MTREIPDISVKLFLESAHPAILHKWDRPFCRGLGKWLQEKHPKIWAKYNRSGRGLSVKKLFS